MAQIWEIKQKELRKFFEISNNADKFRTLSRETLKSHESLKQVKSQKVISILSAISKSINNKIQENQKNNEGNFLYLSIC